MNERLADDLYEAIEKTISTTLDESEEAGFIVDEEIKEALNRALQAAEQWNETS